MVDGYLGFTHRPGVDRIQKTGPVLMALLTDIQANLKQMTKGARYVRRRIYRKNSQDQSY